MCHVAGQSAFLHTHIYLRILIISYLATFLGTNSLSVLMCRKVAINQSKAKRSPENRLLPISAHRLMVADVIACAQFGENVFMNI